MSCLPGMPQTARACTLTPPRPAPAVHVQGAGLAWLFPFVDGHPPIGWGSAAAYLVMPVLLVVSQFASQKIISNQSNNTDPSQQQAQAILKFLPLMIGGFLCAPACMRAYVRACVRAPAAGMAGATCAPAALGPAPAIMPPSSRCVRALP